MTTCESDAELQTKSKQSTIPKGGRQWYGASLREDSTGHPQRAPTRFPSLVTPTLSEGREFG